MLQDLLVVGDVVCGSVGLLLHALQVLFQFQFSLTELCSYFLVGFGEIYAFPIMWTAVVGHLVCYDQLQ